MKIMYNVTSKTLDKTKHGSSSPISDSSFNSLNNYKKRPFKQNQQDLSFKGLSSIKTSLVSDIQSSKVIESFKKSIGASGEDHIKGVIETFGSRKNPWVEVKNGNIHFKEEGVPSRIYHSVIDPVINFPIDLTNSFFGGLKKFKPLKDSTFIDNILSNKVLKDRKEHLTVYSNAMAVQHHAEMIKKLDGLNTQKIKTKDKKELEKLEKEIANTQKAITKEAQKRLNPEISNYTTKAERSFTRLASGIIPAFFLANDAYNLSMYIKNDKTAAEKEKKRRFNQEIARVGITAATTFAALGFFAKKGNSSSEASTFIIAATTLASEVIGRIMTGAPFYPITAKQAQKYAKQEKQKAVENNNDNSAQQKTQKSTTTQEKEKQSSGMLKLLGALVLTGFAVEKLPKHVKPIKTALAELNFRYNSIFTKDFAMSKSEVTDIIAKLRKEGFEKIADDYQSQINKIVENGNLNGKESKLVNREIERRAEKQVSGIIIKDDKDYAKKLDEAKKGISRKDVIKDLGIQTRENETQLHVGAVKNKPLHVVIDQIAGLPVKVVWDIINMPYRYIVKPMVELPTQLYQKIVKGKPMGKNEKATSPNGPLIDGLMFLKKVGTDKNYKQTLNNSFVDSFDNVSKTNFSSAELGGAAKTAVSTVTSAFLVFDNYNRVLIDSEGKDKDLAGQKAQERTVQRMVRIAYGAGLIKLFNNVFSKQYNSSLLNAQLVNVGQSIVTETLERTSVGLPLHAATREEIIQKDKENVEAKGIKGAYFKLMAKLTGKKPLSESIN